MERVREERTDEMKRQVIEYLVTYRDINGDEIDSITFRNKKRAINFFNSAETSDGENVRSITVEKVTSVYVIYGKTANGVEDGELESRDYDSLPLMKVA